MENIGKLDYTTIGAWIFAGLYLLEKVVIPFIGRFIPLQSELQKRIQNRLDSELEFKHEIELRQVVAQEKIADAVGEIKGVLKLLEEKTSSIESNQRVSKQDIEELKIALKARKKQRVT